MQKVRALRNILAGEFSLLKSLIVLVIFSICIYQSITIINNYTRLFVSRIWRTRTLDAYERSAIFLLGKTGADFMQFIASNTPVDKSVVVAERSANFASQNVLQYFLLPRAIVSCDCDRLGGKCLPCLNSPDSYVPATKNFPPLEGFGTDKRFIPFISSTGKSSDYYLGIYVPNDISQQSPDIENSWNYLIVVKTLCIDLIVLICLGLPGFLMTRFVVPGIYPIDALSLSIPMGTALLTWLVFLSSWAGIPITLITVLIMYVLIVFLILLVSRLFRKQSAFSQKFNLSPRLSNQLRQFNMISIATVIGIFAMFISAVFISIGRSYSVYDDIANWSLKGYGIAYAKTIFAGPLLGGHGLAYPLSLPLSIAIFKLASGDILPGSKFLIPIYTAALLWGSFRFLKRRGVNTLIAYVGMFLLITTPQIYHYSTVGYANIPFTACLVLGVLWGIDGLMDRNKGELLLSSLLFGFAGWMRQEGILFGGILIVILLVWQFISQGKKTWHIVYWLFPGLVIPGIWFVFARNYIQGDQAGNALKALIDLIRNGHFNFEPITAIAHYGVKTSINPHMWGLVPPLILFLLVAGLPKIIHRPNRVTWPLFLMALASFVVPSALFWVEAANENDFDTFLSVSFDRAYLPVAVLGVLLAFVVLFSTPEVEENKPRHNHGEIANSRTVH